jgi:DUF1680 family protein
MEKIILASLLFLSINALAQQDYPIHAVPFTDVQLADQFWLPRMEINRTVTIPASFEQCNITGRIKNFEMAGKHQGKFCTAYPFDDTDIYKTLEGASYSLAVHHDKKLEHFLDSLIAIIGSAQEPDGYLYTARTIDPQHPHPWSGAQRWVKEHELSHELYNSGHLFEAAVAHYMSTGKRNLLDIAIKNADLLVSVFGPDKMHVAPGHEIVEMGLVKMYRVTNKKEYLDLAKFFLEQRGERQYNKASKNVWENGSYWQAHEPVISQDEATGHAVRAMYLYSAMTDIAALTGDTSYLNAVDRLWKNMVEKKIYLHGGIGAIGDGERFGENYELPNLTAYAETCAAIGSVFWNYRMFLLHGDAKYIDVLEKTLYNGLISGVGLDGKSFFYTNAMQVRDNFLHHDLETGRSGWFTCSCCPTNITRLIPSIPGYMYATHNGNVYVNLYISGAASVRTVNGSAIQLIQESNYPWDGAIVIKVIPSKSSRFSMLLRIPGWARNEAIPGDLYAFQQSDTTDRAVIKINGKEEKFSVNQGYAVINRIWKKGDSISLLLPMIPRMVLANDSVAEDKGKIALQRGPLIYCAEWVDNNHKTSNLIVPTNTLFVTKQRPDLLNGLLVLEADVPGVFLGVDGQSVFTKKAHLIAIPYYSWANRGKGEMNIWFPEKLSEIDLVTK